MLYNHRNSAVLIVESPQSQGKEEKEGRKRGTSTHERQFVKHDNTRHHIFARNYQTKTNNMLSFTSIQARSFLHALTSSGSPCRNVESKYSISWRGCPSASPPWHRALNPQWPAAMSRDCPCWRSWHWSSGGNYGLRSSTLLLETNLIDRNDGAREREEERDEEKTPRARVVHPAARTR